MSKLIEDPVETEIGDDDARFTRGYLALSNTHEYFIAIGRGAFAFRFGPYTGPEAGKILERALEERIAVTLIGQCSKEFDWEIARDFGMRLVLPEDRKTPLGFFRRVAAKFWRRTD